MQNDFNATLNIFKEYTAYHLLTYHLTLFSSAPVTEILNQYSKTKKIHSFPFKLKVSKIKGML